MSAPRHPQRLVLASGSPRRRELLDAAGYIFEVMEPASEAECGACSGTGPAALVTEYALKKAADVAQVVRDGVILAADTVVECQGQILGKPTGEDHARWMLELLSGEEHRVFTGVCVWPCPQGKPDVRVSQTTLRMDELSERQIDEYLESHQWEGKAGGFGYQDRLGWIHIVAGSESNVVGLPMELVEVMLAEVGVAPE